MVPVAARAHTEKGAEAFVRFYLEQINIAWTKPDPAALDGLWEKGCLSCAGFHEDAQKLVAKRHRYASNPATIKLVVAYNGAPSGQQLVHAVVVQEKVNIIDRSGTTISTDQRKDIATDLLLQWKGNRWLVFDMG